MHGAVLGTPFLANPPQVPEGAVQPSPPPLQTQPDVEPIIFWLERSEVQNLFPSDKVKVLAGLLPS